jgi:hypothetical protein
VKLDLNARRAARADANAEPKCAVLDGRVYQLVDELPVAVMEYAAESDVVGAVKAMLKNPDQDWTEFAKRLTIQDVNELITMYGATLGESLASMDSSVSTGVPSGQTSNGSTALIYPPPFTDPTP